MIQYIAATISAIICLLLSYYAGRTLRASHGSDIRILFYLFSLTLVISSVIGIWATNHGAINEAGSFVGEAGQTLSKLITTTLDIELSMQIILSITSIILAPQILCYLLSGIFGVASSPLFISETIGFLVWGMAKTFIVSSGIITSIAIFGIIYSWQSFSAENIMGISVLTLFLIFLSFFTILIYRESDKLTKDIARAIPNPFIKVAKNIHKLFTRHIKYDARINTTTGVKISLEPQARREKLEG